MLEHQYIVNRTNRARRRPLPWPTIIKLIVVAAAFLWMQHRDQAQIEQIEVQTEQIAELVTMNGIQAQTIKGMECGPIIPMTPPL
jgi:hypothetical protein